MNCDVRERHKRASAAVFGLILIGLGVVFTLDRMGMYEVGQLWSWWPVAVVGVGLASLIAPKNAGDATAGAVTAAVGAFFLAHKLDLIDWRLRDVWPAFLVLGGIVLIVRSLADRRGSPPTEPKTLSNGGAR
jgi:FtsH-binding integral membrane protein